jgi:ATP-dependent RNA helicase RhlE
MLDMGFIRDVRAIAARLPSARQSLMFSATMPEGVTSLVNAIVKNFTRIEVTPPATTVERIDQKVMFVAHENKRKLLDHILADRAVARAIVFSRTKHGANRVAEQLKKGGIRAEAIHGNKSQNARQRALDAFKSGTVRVLVATDIAARGIDVDGVTHVINFDLPMEPESYVHRIGRTARASADGAAVSFCDAEEVAQLRAIEREIRRSVPVDASHPFHMDGIAVRAGGRVGKPDAERNGRPQGRGRRRVRNGRGTKNADKTWSNRAA